MMHDLIRTKMTAKTHTGTYPVYRCDITGRYFIRRLGWLTEVKYHCGEWKRAGAGFPIAKGAQA